MPMPTRYITVAENIVIAISAYILGYYFTSFFDIGTSEIGGLWAVISGLVVIEGTRQGTLKSAKLRLIGSCIGALVSGIYLYFLPFSVVGFAVCIGIGAFICYLLRMPSHVKLTGITISVIMIVSIIIHDADPVMNAGLRFMESIIGALVAVSVATCVSFGYGLKKLLSKKIREIRRYRKTY
ncbi:MAG: FUSC family protein [Thermodesulfobacteriota bacterium]